MKIHFCTFFLLAFIVATINAELDEVCIDNVGKIGSCIKLIQCAKLFNLLKESKHQSIDAHLAAIKIIQQSTCGYLQQDPYVCCSEANQDVQNKYPQNNTILQGSHQVTHMSAESHAPSGFFTTTVPAPTSSPSPITVESKTTQTSTFATFAPTTAAPTTATSTSTTEGTTEEETNASNSDNNTDEKLKLLPEDCGLVLTFKFFHGNRTEFDDFPWTTLIEYDTPSGKRFACGGALISERYVLTAAHCVSGLQPSWKVSGVRFGEYDISTDIDCVPVGHYAEECAEKPVNVAVEKVIAHSGFKPEDANRHHDIALLRLTEKVSFSDFVKPICLPMVPPIPQRYYTSGWGKNAARNGTSLKYMSYLTLDNARSCFVKYRSENVSVLPDKVCAGTKSTERSCIGDEGGPLMGIEERSNHLLRVTTFGVLSMTRPSAKTCDSNSNGWPGVYTRVSDYLPWILHQLKE